MSSNLVPNKRQKILESPSFTQFDNKVDQYRRFYYIVSNARGKKYSEIKKKINREFNSLMDDIDIENYIDEFTRMHQMTLGRELKHIIELSKALESNDKNKILISKAQLIRTDKYIEKMKRASKHSKENSYRAPIARTREENTAMLKEDIKVILKEGRDPEELHKEGKVKSSKFTFDIKSYIKEVGMDDYLDYVEAVKKPGTITEKELKEIQEVLVFFVTNMSDKLDELTKLNPMEDKEEIRRFKVDGEDKLKPLYTKSISKLYAWKVSAIKNRLKVFTKYLDFVTKMVESKDITSIKSVEPTKKHIIKEEIPFLEEDYNKLLRIAKVYKENVINAKSLNEEDRKELDTKFKKRLIK